MFLGWKGENRRYCWCFEALLCTLAGVLRIACDLGGGGGVVGIPEHRWLETWCIGAPASLNSSGLHRQVNFPRASRVVNTAARITYMIPWDSGESLPGITLSY